MYTQCPDCSVAFRVTAEVLKQAAGKVRCGGCGSAFNALEHLSEEKPGTAPARERPDEPAPELTPEVPPDDATGTRPKAISAEQSAALLKTLDELAGEDIRIEDTGVEWRVLSDDEELDDGGPDVIDTREESVVEQLEAIAEGGPAEEMRFDDNTPLPDDFGLDDEPAPASPEPEPTPEVPAEPQPDPGESRVDLLFGEPDEWEDLLGEVGDVSTEDLAKSGADGLEIDTETAVAADAEAGSQAGPEHAAAADDVPLDMDTQFQLQAEAMGVDISGIHAIGGEEIELAGEDEEIDPADRSIEEDLIAAAFEAEAEARKEVSAAEEMLEELSGEHEALDEIDIEAQLADLEAYGPPADKDDAEPDAATAAADEADEADEAAGDEPEDDADDVPDVEVLEFEEPGETESEPDLIDDLHVEQELAIEAELQAAESGKTTEPESGQDEEDDPALSEEEMTINRMIDQDLLAIAVEDDDGFTSTIVQVQPDGDDDAPKEKKKKQQDRKQDSKADDGDSDALAAAAAGGLVETIIMEGESIRGEIDELREAKKASLMEEARSNIASLKQADEPEKRPLDVRWIVAAVVLILVLIGQYIHQQREQLATIPAFNSSIGALYRSIGQPVTPQWNVSGWRFEATKGDIGDGDDTLTIFSRIGNKSESALPYPLIHVALTDRFEEIIGSKVLEPAEYLGSGPDPRKPVAPGASFDAAISIATPAPEATGFRLDVCYRLAGGQLRCAIEDFK